MPIVDVPDQGTKVLGARGTSRRGSTLPRVPTPLRHPGPIEPAPRGLRHPQLEPAPHSLRHLKPLVRGHQTRRASAGREGPPQTTLLLSVRKCEWGSNPLSSTTPHTPQTSGRGRKFFDFFNFPEHSFKGNILRMSPLDLIIISHTKYITFYSSFSMTPMNHNKLSIMFY